ncbi:MAG: zf-HC2 domain-containing protein [Anaerolineae bacterium]|nr:zf-HC2 domain-containing protein [Anaerolineae bacterium]
MECQDLVRYLSDFIDNNLDDELMQAARDHLATCHNCHIVLDSTQKTILLYRQKGQQQGMMPRRHDALFAQLTEALQQRDDDCD